MAFYVLDPEEVPRGKIIRFKTLTEARRFMRSKRRSFRVYFHDLGELSITDAIDMEDLPAVEDCRSSARDTDAP